MKETLSNTQSFQHSVETENEHVTPFSADDFARIIHVIADGSMTHARQLLTNPKGRDEL